MTKETYRRFDPWRATPVNEESRETVLASHYFNVDRVAFESREIGHFERLILHKNNGDSVGVIGLTADGRIPLIEQYRIPVHRWTLEIPAGHAIHPGERPMDVAQRKLAEEVGYRAGYLTQFCRFINTPSYSTQYTALFFANDLVPVDQEGDDALLSSVRYFTPEEAYKLVVNGTILDAKSIIAIQRLYESPNHLIADTPATE
ncbi:NUDIX domain-containing protein [Bifidobacterium cuniculi]|uniref:ADP-ribose pyrophosphatase n=1 Tax=Bifidobacterium cuniculi TaxID=1688 RepID=A0A087B482_9BIFI|nr:NUDIX hydrolase [Bifidobacterium cuniculi]KFI65832.1 ADP-ribose pyrophosphatase [Bifidobacterium cuniculi]